MNEIVKMNNEMSPYNPQFAVQYFKNSVDTKLNDAEKVVETIYKVAMKDSSLVAQAKEATAKGFRLVVDASEETLQAIEEGKIKLTTSKNGKTYAQLLRPDGKYDKKLPIKKEEFAKGVSATEMANALQLKALQQQIEDLSNQIYQIDMGIQEVLRGQQIDRVGLYYSAVSLLVESMVIDEPHLKEALMVQGIRSLSDSIFQLTLKLRDDIQYLESKEYETAKGKKRVQLIDEKIQSINHMFAFIHQGIMLKAGAYCQMNQLGAMTTVLNEYSRFISCDIQPNAKLLSQLDENDTGLDSGLWKSRAVNSFNTVDINYQLHNNNEKVLYIGIEKEQ